MAERLELPTEVVRSDAGFHADQTRRHIGKAWFDLATRPFLTQHNRAALIQADDMEGVLTDIDADHGNCAVEGYAARERIREPPIGNSVAWLHATAHSVMRRELCHELHVEETNSDLIDLHQTGSWEFHDFMQQE